MDKMITVRVTAEQHKQIKILSAETGLSIKEIFWLGVERAREKGAWDWEDGKGDPPNGARIAPHTFK